MTSENNVNLTEEQVANAAQSTPMPEEESQNSGLGMESESAESDDMKEMAAAFDQLPDLYEESLKQYQEGEVVNGRIVAVDKDYVIVDIGYKCEGHIPIHEFLDPNGENTAIVGDQVDVLLERRDDEEDVILLSKEKASKIKIWEEISSAYQQDGEIEGTVTAKVKGGLSVDLGGMAAFLPGSQVDLQPVRNIDSLIGQTFMFKILKYNKKRRNVVLSRRVIMEKERSEQKTATLANLEEGKVVTGTVKNITDYGVFVDLGGIDGLLHVTDMSWGRIGHPSDVFHVGDAIEVKILSFDRDNEKVSLGLKQLTEDPWLVASQRYPVGERVRGKVVSLTDYGAFVELEPGVEGLIHVSEMSWTKKVRHPSKIVSVGDVVESEVLDIDIEKKRISLSMKHVEPNPWDIIGEKYPEGTIIEGKIKNITDFGIFIGIDEGIDGLVHISDISWTKRIKHPSEIYKKGQEVQAKVLKIDKDNERFSLGIKQLADDPWKSIDQRYPIGKSVSGLVTNKTDFGVFIELEEGIEGLIHVSEISRDKNKPVQIEVGDMVTAKVINVSPKDRKIGLSIRKLETDQEQSVYRDYLHSRKEATTPLGELLQERLEESEAMKQEDKD